MSLSNIGLNRPHKVLEDSNEHKQRSQQRNKSDYKPEIQIYALRKDLDGVLHEDTSVSICFNIPRKVDQPKYLDDRKTILFSDLFFHSRITP